MDYMMRRDGRNPYGSAGGYVVSSRRGQRDRARGRDGLMMEDMRRYNRGDYKYGLADMTRQNQEIRHDPYMPRDFETGMVNRGYYRGGDYEYGSGMVDRAYSQQDYARGGRDYEYDRQSRMDYGYDMRRDMHYGGRQGNFQPVEAMGYFTGYYGGGQDMARGGRYDYGYGYDYAGDYGETLSHKEIEEWKKKLMEEVEDKDKQFFNKETFTQRAKQMGIQMGDKFTEEELCLTTLMMYTDYKKTLGTANMDIYIRLAKDWLEDKDVSVKGGEKLAVYYDNIVEDED
jgi:hypothetical protein